MAEPASGGGGLVGRAGWYARRLRTMAPAEIAWRVGRAAQGAAAPALERRSAARLPRDAAGWELSLQAFREARDRPVLLDRERAREVATAHPEAAAALVEAAERVLAHRVRYFGYPEGDLGPTIDFHHDPVGGHDWPRVPARRLDHRTAPGDVKWIWELNRLQHLPWLAEAWLLTGREEFATEAFAQLDAWLEQNPVGHGIAWRGAFEAGVRAISVLVALQGLRDHPALDAARFARLVTVLDAGARICWTERSRFSSANNHLVGELAGLAVVALLLPDLPASPRRLTRAVRTLAQEADLQLLADGAGAEQAVGYQMFTAELLLVVLVLLRSPSHQRLDVPPVHRAALEAAVRRSSGYLAALVGPTGADDQGDPAPRYGDDDEGFALRLGAEEVRTVTDHLAIVAAYAGPDGPDGPDGPGRTCSRGAELAAAWVGLATAAGPRTPLVPAPEELPASFHAVDGGLVVLRRGGQRLTVDVAPLGYLSLAAHGHADALALTWSRDGREVVGDPGTGSYYGHPAWRVVHRGTPAHATVSVDGLDQSVIAGPFLWSQHATVRVHEVDLEAGLVDAEHDGYQRLAEPVTHRRVVRVLDAPEAGEPSVLVVDVLTGEGSHDLGLAWPLAPDLTSRTLEDGHLVLRDGAPTARIVSAATVPLHHDHVVGDEETHHGWWSERLEGRRAAYLLRTSARGPLPVVVATLLVPGEGDAASDLEVRLVGDEVLVTGSALVRTGGRSLSITLTRGSGDQ